MTGPRPMRIPLILLIAALYSLTPPPQSYVVIALLLWLNQKIARHQQPPELLASASPWPESQRGSHCNDR